MKALKGILVGIGILVVIVVWWVLHQAAFVANTAANSAHGIVKQTLNSTNVIYNYHWFQQTFADYSAAKAKLDQAQTVLAATKKSLPSDPSKWSFYQQQSWQEQQDTVLGMQQQLNNIAAKYNAHSLEADRSIFKVGNNLPTSLPYSK